MAKQVISVGVTVNDGLGDSLRAGAQKINDNFTELYDSKVPSQDSQSGKILTTDGINLSWGTNIPGNAATVTNGVYTTGTYANPSWLSSLAYSKLTGTPSIFSGSYVDLTNKPTINTLVPSQSTNDGKFLTTNGSVVSWASPDVLSSRTTASITTASLANSATATGVITGFKSYALLTITTSQAAWVRVYTDLASQSADSTRGETTDPLPNAGVIAEVITTGAQTILISPGVFGFNNDDPVTTSIPVTITNKGTTSAITVSLTLLKLEK
jgi:hypothetical protein